MPAKKFKKWSPRARDQLGNFVKKSIISIAEEKHKFGAIVSNVGATQAFQIHSILAGLAIAQGTGKNERIGEKIRLRRIELYIQMIPVAGTVGTNGSVCRFVVWHSNAANGATPAATGLFDQDNLMSGNNLTYANRYSHLKDFVHYMVPTSSSAGGAVVTSGPMMLQTLKFYPKTVVEYSGTAGTTADIVKHDYGTAFTADDSGCCTIYVYAKVVYTDF